jgi:hypothetical protein
MVQGSTGRLRVLQLAGVRSVQQLTSRLVRTVDVSSQA